MEPRLGPGMAPAALERCSRVSGRLIRPVRAVMALNQNGHSAGTDGPQVTATLEVSAQREDRESSAPPTGRGGRREPRGSVRRWTPPAEAPRRLLTLAETAAYLGLSPWTVRELQWKGRLARVALGRKLLFDRADVDRLIEASKEQP